MLACCITAREASLLTWHVFLISDAMPRPFYDFSTVNVKHEGPLTLDADPAQPTETLEAGHRKRADTKQAKTRQWVARGKNGPRRRIRLGHIFKP